MWFNNPSELTLTWPLHRNRMLAAPLSRPFFAIPSPVFGSASNGEKSYEPKGHQP